MASFIINGSTGHAYWLFRVVVSEGPVDVATNQTRVDCSVEVGRQGNGSWVKNTGTFSVTIDGQTFSETKPYNENVPVNEWVKFWSCSKWVTHNDDGYKNCSISANWNNSGASPASASASGSVNLTRIDRYAKATLSCTSRSYKSASFTCNTDAGIDAIAYSLNGGGYQAVPWQSFSVSALAPNASYSIRCKVKRTDSQLESLSDSISFTTLPLASTTSNVSFNIGDNLPLTISKQGDGTVNLSLSVNGTSILTRTNVSTPNYTIAFSVAETAAVYRACASVNSAAVSVVCTTMSGGASMGTTTKPGTAYVVNSNPIFTEFSALDVNPATLALTGDASKFIAGQSTARVTISPAQAVNGASIVKYDVTDTKTTVTTAGLTADLPAVGSGTLTVTAFDSRQNSAKVEKTLPGFLAYTLPELKEAKALRANGVDQEVTLMLNGSFWNDTFGVRANTAAVQYRFKPMSGGDFSAWTDVPATAGPGNKITCNVAVSGDLGAEGFTIDKSFQIEVKLTDLFGTSIKQLTVDRGVGTMMLYRDRTEFKGHVFIDGEQVIPGPLVPIGTLLEYAGSALPKGYLWADATNYSREGYPELYSVVGLKYSIGHTDTTFNFAKLSGTMPVGYSSSDSDFRTVGATGGKKKHQLTVDEMPSHNHQVMNNSSMRHTDQPSAPWRYQSVDTSVNTATTSTGGNQPHENMPPYRVSKYIIMAFHPGELDIPVKSPSVSGNLTVDGNVYAGGEVYVGNQKADPILTVKNAFLAVHPVGSIYMTVDAALNTADAMNQRFGGTWAAWGAGQVPVGVSNTDGDFALGKTGGEKKHALLENENGLHGHNIAISGTDISNARNNAGSSGPDFWSMSVGRVGEYGFSIKPSGSGSPHNNLQPYITCYMWKRTA